MIEERLAKIEGELAKVKRTRALHRESRRRVPYPIVALVGYTNAGKSTLFNRMTQASVLSADMLFATLDPTLRAVELPHGARVILSDTVGFISDLPTMLVAAFRATLEEVIEADVILHVRDVSHEDAEAQLRDVEEDAARARHRSAERRQAGPDRSLEQDRPARCRRRASGSPISPSGGRRDGAAGPGVGRDRGGHRRARRGHRRRGSPPAACVIELTLDPADGAGMSWLHRHTEVIDKTARRRGPHRHDGARRSPAEA